MHLNSFRYPPLLGLLWLLCLPLPTLAQGVPGVTPTDIRPPSQQPLPEPELPTPPPPGNSLPLPPAPPTGEDVPLEQFPASLVVERYEVRGSTVFTQEKLAEVTSPFTSAVLQRRVSFAELLQARSAVTQLYVKEGYITSGAILPLQTVKNGVVVLEVVEGEVEEINISGTRRLRPDYVRSRLAIATGKPLNRDRLLDALRLLQLDPLIQSVSADLQGGTRSGSNILEVTVGEADTFVGQVVLDNNRTPSVGSFRRRVLVSEGNLLGLGDSLTLGYTNTAGSNGIEGSYSIPVNPRNGQVTISAGTTGSDVIEEPFDVLEISARSRFYELTFRQPIIQTPQEEFALGATLSHQNTRTSLGIDDIGPFPLAPGADDEGRTRASALRLFQEWNRRGSREVLAVRSQLSIGLNIFGATVNDTGPDSRFLSWRGQGQWLRLLAPDTLLLVRGEAQLSDSGLLGLEQFGLGGQSTVRGYRQDFLLADNGLLASAELRLPVLRVPQIQGLLQVAPFLDLGTVWNSEGTDPSPGTLAGFGVGVLWRQGDYLTARLDIGIPLASSDSEGSSWQENGIYFSIIYTPF